MSAKKTEPTQHLYAGHQYVNAANTDIRVLFERIKVQQQKSFIAATKNVSPIKRQRNG
jgi:hypothetical protein